MVEQGLASYFGSQERSKGGELFRKQRVVIASASDTDVRAFVKGSSSARVALSADEVAGPAFRAQCTCPPARKGDLCRHVWAVLLQLEDAGADFLEGKQEALAPGAQAAPRAAAREAKQDEYKERQKQKMKTRAQEMRKEKKESERGPRFAYPAPVREALDYFGANGFPLEDLDRENLLNARKLLSRVFHPDKGGTHEEVLELNAHFETIEDYLKS